MANGLEKFYEDFERTRRDITKGMGAIDAVTRSVRSVYEASGMGAINALTRNMTGIDAATNSLRGIDAATKNAALVSRFNFGETSRIEAMLASSALKESSSIVRALAEMGPASERMSVASIMGEMSASSERVSAARAMAGMDTTSERMSAARVMAEMSSNSERVSTMNRAMNISQTTRAAANGIHSRNDINQAIGRYPSQFETFNVLFARIGNLSGFSTSSSRVQDMISSMANSSAHALRYSEIARSISFSGLVHEFPDISDSDMSSVKELIWNNQEIGEVVKSTVSKGIEIALSNLPENEKDLKFDELFNAFLYEHIFIHLNLSKKVVNIIGFIILFLLIVPYIQTQIQGDPIKAINIAANQATERQKKSNERIVIYGKTNDTCTVYYRNNIKSRVVGKLNPNIDVSIISEGKKWVKISFTKDSTEVFGFILKNKITVDF